MSTEEIRKELGVLRTEIGRVAGVSAAMLARAHSDWSAHGDWSSSSKYLEGQFRLTTKIGNPVDTVQLERIVSDSSSERFLEVAKSLNNMLRD